MTRCARLVMRPVMELVMALVLLALPTWVAARDFGFAPPTSADDAAAAAVMRDLAQRLVPVYQEADTDLYLANLTAMQIVSGAYAAAEGTSRTLRSRYQGQPAEAPLGRAVTDTLYSRARALESSEHIGFESAFARAFRDVMAPLDDAQAAAAIERLGAPLATYRLPVQQAFDRWRATGSIPEADAVALVRTYLAYESRRSYAPFVARLAAAEDRRRYITQADVPIPLPSGVLIRARIVRPAAAKGAAPTLLRFTLDPAEDDAQRSASRGYVGVTAYVRGRKPDGTGAVRPFLHDGDDARAVIDWIARQPWSDGRVGMLGDGYSGYAAWAAASRQPAALKGIATIAPMAPGIDFPMAGQIYRNAMVRWAQQHTLARPLAADADDAARWRALDQTWYQSGRPYQDLDVVLLGQRSPLLQTWLAHPSHDRFWQTLLPTAPQFVQIDVPVLGIAGYFGAEAGALYYHREHVRARPQADDTLLIGPYDPGSIRPGTAATLRGDALDAAAQVDLGALRLAWFDHLLKGGPPPALLQGRINYQVMGANQWRHAPSLAALQGPDRAPLRLYLDMQRRDGPYRLSASRTDRKGNGPVELAVNLADRSDATPTSPDALRLAELPARSGLAFVGDPLPKDTEIVGGLRGRFALTPSRQDVDLSVALYELTAGGVYKLLFEPYDFRASYARDRTRRHLLAAGQRQWLDFIAERMTACRLAAGSRIVLVVGINKRADRQINHGSGKDVNSESIDDAGEPMRLRWHAGSYIEIGNHKP
jgi:putative CocE/NonD family hydrolase